MTFRVPKTPTILETASAEISCPEEKPRCLGLRVPVAPVVTSFRILCGMARTCPACATATRARGICRKCRAQAVGPAGPWETRQISSAFLRQRLTVHYFGHYDCPSADRRCRIADLLAAFKYAGRRDAGRDLGRVFAGFPSRSQERFDAIVPIPLTPAKLRRRGFNQAAWLARPAARALRVPLRPGFLHRTADPHGPQAGRTGAERRLLGPDLFVVTRKSNRLNGAAILLVDDVCTTGTTLAQAARALLCAGALRVEAAVLLITDPRLTR